MPLISVIMPVYHVEAYIQSSVESVLSQSFQDFELLVIDDGGSDQSMAYFTPLKDPRIRIIHQENRGLAGARNTGIRFAKAELIAFLDSDDIWHHKKLEKQVKAISADSDIGILYCGSRLINESGAFIGITQTPKLHHIHAQDVFTRNPIGNGSVALIRRQVLEEIAFKSHRKGEKNYFDEAFKQSEDIELWTRIALMTNWKFIGIPDLLVDYRVNSEGLSSNFLKQYQSWLCVYQKLKTINPDFIKKHGSLAHAYQLRYLSRQAISNHDGDQAWQFMLQALSKRFDIIFKEPLKTITSFIAAGLLKILPVSFFCFIEKTILSIKRRL